VRLVPIILKVMGFERFDHSANWPARVRNVSRLGSQTFQILSTFETARRFAAVPNYPRGLSSLQPTVESPLADQRYDVKVVAPNSSTPPNQGSIWAGMGLSLACQLFTLLFLVVWMAISKDPLLYFVVLLSGLVQWILVFPLFLWLRSRGKKATVKGVLILSFLGVLLNAIGVALVMARNSNSTRFF
jgi:heme/copper-type cytochrome/quinol oxidase subunit 4